MAYKILHLPTATYVYDAGLTSYGTNIPVLSFEVIHIDDKEHFRVALFRTKKEAWAELAILFKTIKVYRGMFKRQPELYTCCLRRRFYTLVKVSD